MNHCPHHNIAAQRPGSASPFAIYEVPVTALGSIRPPRKARTCSHFDRLAAPGWYVVFSRTGIRVTVDKVGQSGRVLPRVREQRSNFDPRGTVLMIVAAPDGSLDENLRHQVEWALGCTLARAAAHGLLTATYGEPFTKVSDTPADATQSDALTIAVLHGVADTLGCGVWQLLALRQPSSSLWPATLLYGKNGGTLRRLRRLFDAGLISPGDRLAFLADPVEITITERLLCRIGLEPDELPLRQTADELLSRGPYSENTRRNAWDAFTIVSNDFRTGHSLNKLHQLAPSRISLLTAKCHLRW